MSILELSQSAPGPLRRAAGTAELPRLPAVSSTTDTALRASTAAAVLAVAGIAAYISYWHAYAVVRQYGESGVTALLEPGTIDGLVYASSMVILHAARAPAAGPAAGPLDARARHHRLARRERGPGLVPRPGRRGSGSVARRRPGGLLRTARLDDPDRRTKRPGPRADHGVPEPDHPRTMRPPAGSLTREAVPAAGCRDGASPEPDSAHDQFPAAHAIAQVRGPGPAGPGCAGQTDRGNQAGGPTRKTGPRGPGGPGTSGTAAATAPAGDVDAAAVAAYRASVREGRPLSERKLAAAFGKTSRRWARDRMAEAGQVPAAG